MEVLPSGEQLNFPSNYTVHKNFKDSSEMHNQLNLLISRLQNKGYIACYLDSLIKVDNTFFAYINIGDLYEWMRLGTGNVDKEVLARLNFSEKKFSKKLVSVAYLNQLMDGVLNFYSIHGYPFSTIRLSDIFIINQQVSANLKIELNNKVTLDSIRIFSSNSSNPIHENYLESYLGLKKGSNFNLKRIKEVDKRLGRLPFLTSIRKSEFIFGDSYNLLDVFIDKKNANVFDGLIGFLPNKNGKINFYGELNLKLINALKRGELFSFEFKALPNSTSDLKLYLNYPYIFKTNFGMDGIFELHKQDSSFISNRSGLGVLFQLIGGDYLKLFYERNSSSILTNSLTRNSISLILGVDFVKDNYGIAINLRKLDNEFNPSNGYTIFGTTSFGSKRILPNANFSDSVFNSIPKLYNDFNYQIRTSYYWNFFGKSVIKFEFFNSQIFSKNIYKNELMRFGGINSLRGFDEQSIWASNFYLGKIEYRFLFDKLSNLFLFYDQAYYEQRDFSNFFADNPLGFGAGINLETKAGIFSFAYGLGLSKNNPLNLQTGKVHFGLVNNF